MEDRIGINAQLREVEEDEMDQEEENPQEFPDETTCLLRSGQQSTKSTCFVRRHKKCVLSLSIITIVAILLAIATYFIYFHGRLKLKVFAFNVWGMPGGLGGCKYKQERMDALAQLIQNRSPYFDIFLFEELWMEADHNRLEQAAKSVGLYATDFRQLSSSLCDGRVLVTGCSGLAVISAYPIKEFEFHEYYWKGTIWDGEDLAGKGVGRVQIEPQEGTLVDIFVTHTIADSGTKMANNTWYRVKQVEELMESYVKKSKADAIILGGDFNTPPRMDPGEPYEIIQKFMKNSAEEIFSQLKEWLLPKFATYGNQRNSFSYMYEPITYDYIFHKGNNPQTVTWTNWFELPFLQTNITAEQKEVFITLSDHEPVISTIYIKKFSDHWPYI